MSQEEIIKKHNKMWKEVKNGKMKLWLLKSGYGVSIYPENDDILNFLTHKNKEKYIKENYLIEFPEELREKYLKLREESIKAQSKYRKFLETTYKELGGK
jgi:hypothetical protein